MSSSCEVMMLLGKSIIVNQLDQISTVGVAHFYTGGNTWDGFLPATADNNDRYLSDHAETSTDGVH